VIEALTEALPGLFVTAIGVATGAALTFFVLDFAVQIGAAPSHREAITMPITKALTPLQRFWRWAKGCRTLTFNVLVAVFAALEVFDLSRIITDPKRAAMAALVVSIVNIVLRIQTTGPVRRPGPDPDKG